MHHRAGVSAAGQRDLSQIWHFIQWIFYNLIKQLKKRCFFCNIKNETNESKTKARLNVLVDSFEGNSRTHHKYARSQLRHFVRFDIRAR